METINLPSIESIAKNLNDIRDNIEKSARKSGRTSDDVTLVAVTKKFPPQIIDLINQLGLKHVGENYVQEALEKMSSFKGRCTIHMIGRLQSNKVKKAVQLFDMIQTIDRIKILNKLENTLERLNPRGRPKP